MVILFCFLSRIIIELRKILSIPYVIEVVGVTHQHACSFRALLAYIDSISISDGCYSTSKGVLISEVAHKTDCYVVFLYLAKLVGIFMLEGMCLSLGITFL